MSRSASSASDDAQLQVVLAMCASLPEAARLELAAALRQRLSPAVPSARALILHELGPLAALIERERVWRHSDDDEPNAEGGWNAAGADNATSALGAGPSPTPTSPDQHESILGPAGSGIWHLRKLKQRKRRTRKAARATRRARAQERRDARRVRPRYVNHVHRAQLAQSRPTRHDGKPSFRVVSRERYDEIREAGSPASKTLVDWYGSWLRVCKAADGLQPDGRYLGISNPVPPPRVTEVGRQQYDRIDCLKAIQKCALKLGHWPSCSDYIAWRRAKLLHVPRHERRKAGLPTYDTIKHHCGGWPWTAERAAALSRPKSGRPRHQRAENLRRSTSQP